MIKRRPERAEVLALEAQLPPATLRKLKYRLEIAELDSVSDDTLQAYVWAMRDQIRLNHTKSRFLNRRRKYNRNKQSKKS